MSDQEPETGIVRVEKGGSTRYTIIRRATLEDANLSFGARGLLAYLLCKPDNWQVRMTDLINASPAGREAVRTLLSELVTAGYVVRTRKQTPGGFIWETVVYEKPIDGIPVGGEPVDGKAVDLTSTKKINTNRPSAPKAPIPAVVSDGENTLPPLELVIPEGLSAKPADRHVATSPAFRCPDCHIQLNTEMDQCPDCGRKIVWLGKSANVDRRLRRQGAQEADARAKARRQAQRAAGLSPIAKKTLLDAVEADFNGDVDFHEGEARKIDAYVAKYGEAAYTDLWEKVKKDNPDASGRGLIIILLRKMPYASLPTSEKGAGVERVTTKNEDGSFNG